MEGKLAGKVNIGDSGITNMAQVFRWDPDNGLTIGSEGGEFKTVLSSSELAFYQGENTLEISRMEVLSLKPIQEQQQSEHSQLN